MNYLPIKKLKIEATEKEITREETTSYKKFIKKHR
jgi:hypothetical protein